MSQSPYTAFYVLICLTLSLGIGYVEVAWLRRTPNIILIWPGLVMVATINFAFLLFGIYSLAVNTYMVYLYFPIPVVPVILILIKVGVYYLLHRMTKADLHAPWLVSVVMTSVGGIVGGAVLSFAASINPTYQNLYQAITQKENDKLGTMLAVAVAHEPMMSDLINSALSSNNAPAIQELTRAGANPLLRYNFPGSGSGADWELVKWQLDNAHGPNEIVSIDETLSCFSTERLKYGLDKGVDPKKFPGFLHRMIRCQGTRNSTRPFSPGETEAMISKLNLLIDRGAEVNGDDEFGYKPIAVLFTLNLPVEPLLRVIIEGGGRVNEQTPQPINITSAYFLPKGMSPLMLASVIGDAASVRLLLEKNADKNLKNSENKTALDYATLSGDPKIILLLQ